MSSYVHAQQLAPHIRRVAWSDQEPVLQHDGDAIDRIADPALGAWARRRIMDTAWASPNPFEGFPEPLQFEQRSDGTVSIVFPLQPGEQLYGAADADASGLVRRGDHVHLATELHPRAVHRGVEACAMCAARIARDPGNEDGDDLAGDRSVYGELHAPFVISSAGYGVWISNATYGSVLDLGESSPDQWSFTAPGGVADIYLIGPGSMPEIVRAFTRLTGKAPLPPVWALGFIQSKFGYESFDAVDDVIDRFHAERLPLHGVVFDVQWLEEHVNLRWNPDGFAEPQSRLADIHDAGVRTVVITEPGTRADASNFGPGQSRSVWGVDEDGDIADSKQWYAREQIEGYRTITPTTSAIVNAFRDDAADWWYEQHLPLIADGVDAWWLDLNEPEGTAANVHFPDTDWPSPRALLHGHDAHNMFAIAQQRLFARRDRAHTNRRTFMLSRSGHAGSGRYGVAPWSGDIGATWQSLRVQPRLMLTAGLCGFGLYGCDVGGFHGEPESELFARWLQAGTMFPICRAHGSMSDREPWSRGEDALAAAAPAIRLRGQLLPSIASWMGQACEAGEPMVRPMLWVDPSDDRFIGCEDQWLFGPLLAAPVLHPGVQRRNVHLPAGNEWIHLWSGDRYAGGTTAEVDVDASSLPVFVPAGTLLVVDPKPLNRRGTQWPPAELEVWAFPDDQGLASCDFTIDDGISRDHEQGAYSSIRISLNAQGELQVERSGGAWPTPRLRLAHPTPGQVS